MFNWFNRAKGASQKPASKADVAIRGLEVARLRLSASRHNEPLQPSQGRP